MLQKILKGLFILSGASWILYGVSENVLNYARFDNAKRSGSEDIPKVHWQPVVKVAFENFKKAYELLK